MLKKIVRFAWQAQPRWLRMKELNLIQALLSRPLDLSRPLQAGDVIVGGFLGTTSGLGKSARQMMKLFEARGLPVLGANASRFAILEDFEAGSLWPPSAHDGGIAIFHINPDVFPLIVGAIGRRRLQSRRVVGLWAWELENLPPRWRPSLRLVDEVWVPSSFIANAVRAAAPGKPIHIMPPFLDVQSVPTSPRTDPLPQFAGRPMVFFMYDVRSVHARKNPEGVIAAFRQATEGKTDPVLVIKVNNAHVWPEAMARLQRAAADAPNICLMTEKLGDDGMQDLIARADIVMSLHRSEGFGLLMAEAMAAAKPVIATGWSANLDFMPPECTALIDYRLIPVVDPQHVYDRYNAHWADPDINQAANILKRLLGDPNERKRMGDAARTHIAGYLSAGKIFSMLPDSFWNAIGGSDRQPRTGRNAA